MKKLLFFLPMALFAEDGAQPARSQNMYQTVIMIGIALVFFYFILWRPEQKRRKKMEQQRGNLRSGDKVTAMGIVGTVVKIEETTVILKMHDGSQLEFLKAAITEVHAPAHQE